MKGCLKIPPRLQRVWWPAHFTHPNKSNYTGKRRVRQRPKEDSKQGKREGLWRGSQERHTTQLTYKQKEWDLAILSSGCVLVYITSNLLGKKKLSKALNLCKKTKKTVTSLIGVKDVMFHVTMSVHLGSAHDAWQDKCTDWQHRRDGHVASQQHIPVLLPESFSGYSVRDKNPRQSRVCWIEIQCAVCELRVRDGRSVRAPGQAKRRASRPGPRSGVRVHRRVGGQSGIALEHPRDLSRCSGHRLQLENHWVLASHKNRSNLPEDGRDVSGDVRTFRLENCIFDLRRR